MLFAHLRQTGGASEWPARLTLARRSVRKVQEPRPQRSSRAVALNAESSTKIKVIIFDFDGVLTDNRVLVFDDGREAVLCNRSDGLFISLLKQRGYALFIVSKEQNPVVTVRGRKLKVEVTQGVDDKVEAVERILCRQGITANEVIYVGNDINDLGAMSIVGLPVAVGDAHPAVKRAAKRVLKTVGGAGVVRELFESVLGEPLPVGIRG